MNVWSERATLAAALRQDLGTFVAKVFRTVSPGDLYQHNWHIDAVAYALLQVHCGETLRLIITQPPRSLKSICASVAFVAWALGHEPSKRFACLSYSQELAGTFARQFRAVVTSDWYRALFPHVQFVKDTESECVTTLGGGRIAVAVGGSFTGRGADVIIVDDPIKAEEAQSEKARSFLNDYYGSTLLSRLDDKGQGAIILVMQRLHEDDLAGKLLRDGGWSHLDLPAIAQEDQEIAIGPGTVHRRKKGEILHPERESLALLEAIKREMGSLAFSAQYLQRPVPLEGNLIKRSWLKSYDETPKRGPGVQIVQSWDVASTTAATSDWSVCTTWAIVRRDYYLLHVWRGRLEFPHLKQKLIALARENPPNRILIERAGPGLHLIQELRANPTPGVPMPIGIAPEGDKLMRMEAQSARFEAGQVYLPPEATWLSEFLLELLGFPNARQDDQVDSVSQFLNWVEANRVLSPVVSMFGPKIFYG
ncbi:MAG: phage terminase large subunit [Bradyrhizobiaceae bacterium]|nr:phage terminase large subunit [Bradyrhizobiaceae bacterium]